MEKGLVTLLAILLERILNSRVLKLPIARTLPANGYGWVSKQRHTLCSWLVSAADRKNYNPLQAKLGAIYPPNSTMRWGNFLYQATPRDSAL